MRRSVSIKFVILGLVLNGMFALGAKALDRTSPPSFIYGEISGLEALQPDVPTEGVSIYVEFSTYIVIFADAPDDMDFLAQIDILRQHVDDLAARNVILLTDTAPDENSSLRQSLRPRGFSILLIDSTGTLAQRRRTVTDLQRLIRQIDEMP